MPHPSSFTTTLQGRTSASTSIRNLPHEVSSVVRTAPTALVACKRPPPQCPDGNLRVRHSSHPYLHRRSNVEVHLLADSPHSPRSSTQGSRISDFPARRMKEVVSAVHCDYFLLCSGCMAAVPPQRSWYISVTPSLVRFLANIEIPWSSRTYLEVLRE